MSEFKLESTRLKDGELMWNENNRPGVKKEFTDLQQIGLKVTEHIDKIAEFEEHFQTLVDNGKSIEALNGELLLTEKEITKLASTVSNEVDNMSDANAKLAEAKNKYSDAKKEIEDAKGVYAASTEDYDNAKKEHEKASNLYDAASVMSESAKKASRDSAMDFQNAKEALSSATSKYKSATVVAESHKTTLLWIKAILAIIIVFQIILFFR